MGRLFFARTKESARIPKQNTKHRQKKRPNGVSTLWLDRGRNRNCGEKLDYL